MMNDHASPRRKRYGYFVGVVLRSLSIVSKLTNVLLQKRIFFLNVSVAFVNLENHSI